MHTLSPHVHRSARRVPVLPLLVLAALVAGALVVPRTAHASSLTDGLVLWYRLDAQAGSVAVDSSGNGRDGTVNGSVAWERGRGLAFDGSSTYVQVPDNVLSGLASVTVAADVYLDSAQATPYFLYGFGNSSGGSGNGYLFSTGDPYRASISLSNWSGEQTTKPSDGHALARTTWKHIAYTQTGTTAVLYEDGVEVARNTSVSVLPTAIHGGGTTANYIGRSLYASDAYFKGKMRDFRVYDRALAGAEVASLASNVNSAMLAADSGALSLGDTGGVTGNLSLPTGGGNGSTIAWASSDPGIVSTTGAVTRPALGRPDAHVTLTATLTHGTLTATRRFRVTVLAEFTDRQATRHAADALVVHNVSDVRENLDLPTTGAFGTTVSWATDRPTVLAATGEVTRPAPGRGTTTVTLTATVTKGTASTTRQFLATVPALPAPAPYQGYLFSYFTGEGYANGEQVYFSLSKGNDPLHWQQLNNSNPVLESTLGTKGLRDPFIIRSPEGDKFYQIATDLKIYGNGNWDASQRTGSRSIMVWESTDLVHWTNQRLVKVSPDTAGNTWAPEAFYDPTIGAYVVFWASKLYAANDPDHTGDTYNKMMYATTRDFYTFSTPQVWKDPGYSVIDSTMIQHNGEYYRFTKDERNQTSSSPCSKFIIEERSATVRNLNYDFVAECIGRGAMSQGEGPLVFKDNLEEKWHLFIDEYGGRGYIPFESASLDSGVWTASTNYSLPGRPRHGTVLPVTQAEYDRLLGAYQPDQLVTRVDPVRVWTHAGEAPALPATVTAHYADGSTRAAAVTWNSVPASAYAADGEFTVDGSSGARATVMVTSGAIPVESVSAADMAVRMAVGVSRALKSTVLPVNAANPAVRWTSSNPSVATVTDAGVVATLRPGHTRLTVHSVASPGLVDMVNLEVTRDIPADLLLWYKFDETGGTVATDASGRGNDGTYSGTPTWGSGVDGGAFVLGGNAKPAYVTIPNGVLSGLDSVTVSTWVRWNDSTTANEWVYGLGTDSSRYLFGTPRNGGGVLYSAITTGSWSAESGMAGSAPLTTGGWQHLAVTVDGTAHTAVLYLNGSRVASATGVTVKPSDLYDAAKGYSGYIGRSLYAADPYFTGAVDDFRVYGRALSATEVMELAGDTAGIASVGLSQLKAPAVVTDASSRVVLPVVAGTDLAHLAPRFTLAHGARISPASGTVRNLTRPVTYTVTGSDGARREWTVEAHVMRSPVLPGLYADPNIAVFGNTFYMYPTTDGFPGWTGTQFHAFSSTDLLHWTDHGVILDLGPDISWADNRAWAPTIAERNGRYYFYFCANGNIGVAVADSPVGPFHDALGKPLVASGAFAGQMIDPDVFTDDDGQSYLYWGNGHGYVVKLNADMTSFDASAVKEITPSGFNEGSFVIKRDGTYYFMWSQNDTRSADYQVAYATGPTPYGPFTDRGLILTKRPELGILGTGHHSVVQVPGTDDWYIAYHRFAIPGGDGTHRETTIDRLVFNPDGSIAPVRPTLESVDPIGP
ncbi:MAG TPA: family 43 glycosylhydrolase [Rugosimonospora sp.]|nr:family 43 glycosylhydrolase [Rugosimonospora sp.]